MRPLATVRALPTVLKIGFAEAVAYRAELAVWVLSTTMPLIMLALWSAVARDAPVGRFGQTEFMVYFLTTFIVRQLTGSWVSWEMNFEIRQGTLSARLLRPLHPLIAYAAENLASLPLRLVVALPVAVIGLALVGRGSVADDWRLWMLVPVAIAGSWTITFLSSFCIGCLAFFTESSVKVAELWLVLFFVFSGYTIPIELFPRWLRVAADWLPFRYQIGLPVELMTNVYAPSEALWMLLRQGAWLAALLTLAVALWRLGLRRFAAYGG